MNPYLRETLVGLVAGSLPVVVLVALAEGGAPGHFASALLLVLISAVAPVVAVPAAPWLLVVITVAAGLIYLQSRRLPVRFLRYAVGAEVVLWLFLGMWCASNIVAVSG